jgi:hypothetical protein
MDDNTISNLGDVDINVNLFSIDGYFPEASVILQVAKIKHDSKSCECYLKGHKNFCQYAGWKNGVIPSKQIVEDYHYETNKRTRE